MQSFYCLPTAALRRRNRAMKPYQVSVIIANIWLVAAAIHMDPLTTVVGFLLLILAVIQWLVEKQKRT